MRPSLASRILATAFLGTLALTGCTPAPVAKATPSAAPTAESRTIALTAEDVEYTSSEQLYDSPVVWIERGKSFGVTTWGSSGCPSIPSSIDVVTASKIVVNISESGTTTVCTADYAPHTSRVDLPDDVDGLPLSISVNYVSDPAGETRPDWVLQ